MVAVDPHRIVVVGVSSASMAVAVEDFPIGCESTAFPAWASLGIGGVGFQVARVLRSFGDSVALCTVVGRDLAGRLIRRELRRHNLLGPGAVPGPASSLGLALVTDDGRRRGLPYLHGVNAVRYPAGRFRRVAKRAELAVMTNVGFARALLPHAVALRLPIAVDLHLIPALDHEYNRPWLEVAQVVFCSHERLPCSPPEWIARVFERYPRCMVVGVGCGAGGSVLGLRNGLLATAPAVTPYGVRDTLGAGDALFASFLHQWLATGDAVDSLAFAAGYAGWKVGQQRRSSGRMPSPAEMARLHAAVSVEVSTWRR